MLRLQVVYKKSSAYMLTSESICKVDDYGMWLEMKMIEVD